MYFYIIIYALITMQQLQFDASGQLWHSYILLLVVHVVRATSLVSFMRRKCLKQQSFKCRPGSIDDEFLLNVIASSHKIQTV